MPPYTYATNGMNRAARRNQTGTWDDYYVSQAYWVAKSDDWDGQDIQPFVRDSEEMGVTYTHPLRHGQIVRVVDKAKLGKEHEKMLGKAYYVEYTGRGGEVGAIHSPKYGTVKLPHDAVEIIYNRDKPKIGDDQFVFIFDPEAGISQGLVIKANVPGKDGSVGNSSVQVLGKSAEVMVKNRDLFPLEEVELFHHFLKSYAETEAGETDAFKKMHTEFCDLVGA